MRQWMGWVVAAMLLVLPWQISAQEVFVLDEGVKMSPEGQIFSSAKLEGYEKSNAVWDGKTIDLRGAKGEGLAFQVMVRAGAEPLKEVNVKVDWKEAGPGKAEVFRQWYVEVTRKSTSPHGNAGLGFYPDALIPADAPKHGLPMEIAAGKVQGFWVDLRLGREAAGNHPGTVTVSSAGKTIATLPLNVRVYNFALPAERHLRWRVGYSGFEEVADFFKIPHDSDEFRKIEAQLYRMCWEDCRIVPTTHYNSPVPKTSGKGAELKIDWTDYDQRFGAYLDGSAFADKQPVNIFSLPVNPNAGWPTGTRSLQELDAAALEAATKQMAQHWDQKKWNLKDGFCYIADEPGPDRYEVIKKACQTIRDVDKRIATSVAFYTHFGKTAPELVKAFAGYVTMWDIAGDFMNLPALAERRKAGDTVGFYQGSEPYQGSEALDGDGLSLVTWPWIAWRYQLDHLFLYNTTEWTYFRLDRGDGRNKPWSKLKREIWENPLNQSWQTNSQGVLMYPGQYVGLRGVVATMRLKQARRGMQDYEYFWLLGQKGQKNKADEICRRLMPKALHEAVDGKYGDELYGPGAWERDPRKWEAARREMAELIEKGG